MLKNLRKTKLYRSNNKCILFMLWLMFYLIMSETLTRSFQSCEESIIFTIRTAFRHFTYSSSFKMWAQADLSLPFIFLYCFCAEIINDMFFRNHVCERDFDSNSNDRCDTTIKTQKHCHSSEHKHTHTHTPYCLWGFLTHIYSDCYFSDRSSAEVLSWRDS